jgi:hypothetical protein
MPKLLTTDNSPSEDEFSASEAEKIPTLPRQKKSPAAQRKRTQDTLNLSTTSEAIVKKRKRTPTNTKHDAAAAVTYTIDGVLQRWSDATEYGLSFRGMTMDEQKAEVVVLNKGAMKGMKGIIKSKLLVTNYNMVVADKLRAHISDCRVTPASMFHCSPKNITLVTSNPKFLSVGEWVEVDADRTPGYNSEGGIVVIVSVHDDLADVK